MRVWVTRTQPGAERTADRLRELGHEPVVAPVLETRPVPWAPDLDDVGALAFTSANAVRAFARATEDRCWPVYAVGDATARAARLAGFTDVRSASGDVGALATLLRQGADSGEVLHVAGRLLAGDLVGELIRAGVPARMATLYDTVPTEAPPPSECEAVLVHSPHAGRVLADMARGTPLLSNALFACISEAAAKPLREVGAPRVAVAVRPDEPALLALLPAAPGRLLTQP